MIDPQLEDLISRLLAKDPNQRITMQEIKVEYEHYYFLIRRLIVVICYYYLIVFQKGNIVLVKVDGFSCNTCIS